MQRPCHAHEPPSEASAGPKNPARYAHGPLDPAHRAVGAAVRVVGGAPGGGPVPGARVVRTRDAMVSALNWRRASFEALAGGGGDGYEPAPSRIASVFVPDLAVAGWLPFALPRAHELAGGADAVI